MHMYRVDNPRRSNIFLPYVYVMDGGVIVKAMLGLTKRHAAARGNRLLTKLQAEDTFAQA